jgi:D-lactate dehydrogenase
MGLRDELVRIIDPQRVLTRRIDRIAFANDASVYRLVPRAVVLPSTIAEVQELFRFSRSRKIPLTFRAAGTSLSGQAVTDGILVVVSRHWNELRVEDAGKRVRVQPGIVGDVVNRHLQPFGAKIGPDPASISACMMGGILANNSSGMCCGVVQNAYHTLESIRFVLPSGLVVDTAETDGDARLAREAPALSEGLLTLRQRIESNPALRERIRDKYRMKNTNGYSLNAFVDFERPIDILGHLMIGSEGTLGFVAEAVLNTVPDYPLKYTGMLYFENVPSACSAIAALRDSGARALELMDRASLRSIAGQPGVPAEIRELPTTAAALLVEYQCETEDELEDRKRDCRGALPSLALLHAPDFTVDARRQAALWKVRKGLIPSVGAMRRRGTSFILEDVVFPIPRLAEGVSDLQTLFERFGYHDAIVFGHAKDGNLHFVLIQAFDDPAEVARYDRFMHALADVVVGRYDGALKAEHGTGRNMAPFVGAEWGPEAYAVMRELKQLVDPDGMLNPGVILNDDRQAHVRHLKELATVEEEVDQCIECGFCERLCPSRELTLTPRQRIVVRREIARLRQHQPHGAELAELEADFQYDAIDTCATDGMCAIACPVDIDTGELVKRLRFESHSELAEELAAVAAERFSWIEPVARLGLRLGGLLRHDLPPPARPRLPKVSRTRAHAVYFPSCVSRVVGPDRGSGPAASIVECVTRVAERAGCPVWIPDDVAGTCCGMPFSSKGFRRAHEVAANRAIERFWNWSNEGALPVVIDTSPCALSLKRTRPSLDAVNRWRFDRLEILDGIEYALRLLDGGLRPLALKDSVVLHPVCSVHKMELVEAFEAVARQCATDVTRPIGAGCCGFAGDRGFSFPELTAAATRVEAAEVKSTEFSGYYSSSRTCEIGLSRATGQPYQSFWALLDEVTRP